MTGVITIVLSLLVSSCNAITSVVIIGVITSITSVINVVTVIIPAECVIMLLCGSASCCSGLALVIRMQMSCN